MLICHSMHKQIQSNLSFNRLIHDCKHYKDIEAISWSSLHLYRKERHTSWRQGRCYGTGHWSNPSSCTHSLINWSGWHLKSKQKINIKTSLCQSCLHKIGNFSPFDLTDDFYIWSTSWKYWWVEDFVNVYDEILELEIS